MRRVGQAIRAAAQRVKLPRDDYFEFRTRMGAINAIELEALRAAEEFKQRAAQAQQSMIAFFTELGKKHDFDPTLIYRWDDETCELIVTEKEDL